MCYQNEQSDLMKFRLVYDGRLPSASNSSRKKEKHDIRKSVHQQLRQFIKMRASVEGRHGIKSKTIQIGDFQFVPLVTKAHAVFCHLDILFLRSGPPGSIVIGGDLDNRLKTLFDALRAPHSANELPSNAFPDEDEKVFRCLLEDDSLITGHSVTTDRLLAAPDKEDDVRLIIQVQLEPVVRGEGNLGF
jgi:hypothetical protein